MKHDLGRTSIRYEDAQLWFGFTSKTARFYDWNAIGFGKKTNINIACPIRVWKKSSFPLKNPEPNGTYQTF